MNIEDDKQYQLIVEQVKKLLPYRNMHITTTLQLSDEMYDICYEIMEYEEKEEDDYNHVLVGMWLNKYLGSD